MTMVDFPDGRPFPGRLTKDRTKAALSRAYKVRALRDQGLTWRAIGKRFGISGSRACGIGQWLEWKIRQGKAPCLGLVP